jgi:predicted RNA polymerase sigma factor
VADTEGFEEFYVATVGRVLGQLFPVTGDLHEAEEVVQEAFARPRPAGAASAIPTCPRPGCGGWP